MKTFITFYKISQWTGSELNDLIKIGVIKTNVKKYAYPKEYEWQYSMWKYINRSNHELVGMWNRGKCREAANKPQGNAQGNWLTNKKWQLN